MSAFSALTPNEQSSILAFGPEFRGTVLQLAKALNRVAALDAAWISNIKAINAKVDATEVIPDTNGLAGSQTMTAADLLSAMNALEAMLATNNSAAWRAAYFKLAGIAAALLTG